MKLPFTKEQTSGEVKSHILVVTFGLLLAALLFYIKNVWGVFAKIMGLATPFFIGFGIAFMMGPVQRSLDRFFKRTLFKKGTRMRLMHAITALLSLLLLAAIVIAFLAFMMPQLIASVRSILDLASRFARGNAQTINDLLVKYDFLNISGDEFVLAWDNIVSSLLNNLNNVGVIVENLVSISGGIVTALYHVLVSLITAFYIMMDKDLLAARIKKIGYATMKRSTIETLIYWTRRANRIFTGFISGKIVDSLIIGAICYVCMLIFRMEFPMLISSIVCVTNIIPFFGPFIGWAPSALILLIVNPMSALWFSIFILVLQQLDGNVIGPHILGDYVGVSALSIMIAIVIGSGLFGFVGMLLSVPVYALIYAILKTVFAENLKKKSLPTETEDFIGAPESLPKEEPKKE